MVIRKLLFVMLLSLAFPLAACDDDSGNGDKEICDNGLDDDGDGFIDCVDQDCFSDSACSSNNVNNTNNNNLNPEVCDNGLDDDLDGFADCLDVDCAEACTYSETCDNGTDDDGDGFIDCDDQDCFSHQACAEPAEEICDNGIDDDWDGLLDCHDPDCADFPGCEVTEEICNNSLDDDGDGLIDCADPDCQWFDGCIVHDEICENGIDDDLDGRVDCDDPDCLEADECLPGVENCADGLDNDGDGFVDCEDQDCWNSTACNPVEEICWNGLDDDGDGLVDCEDPDCSWAEECMWEDCWNGIDDNFDGLVDCDDPQCAGLPDCGVVTGEICNNGVDDDGDGAVDCYDSECSHLAICSSIYEYFNPNTSGDSCDLSYTNIQFSPGGSALYVWSAVGTNGWAVEPGSTSDSYTLQLADDDSQEIELGFAFPFYNGSYSSVYVGSNGFLTFGSPDTDFTPTLSEFLLGSPRIALLWDDYMVQPTLPVIVDSYPEMVVLTYVNASIFNGSQILNVQVVLHAFGGIEMTFLDTTNTEGIVGITAGGGSWAAPEVNFR